MQMEITHDYSYKKKQKTAMYYFRKSPLEIDQMSLIYLRVAMLSVKIRI